MSQDSPAALLYDDVPNGPVAVKPASTAPTVTDKALVVVMSPNQQPIPISSAVSTATTAHIFGRKLVPGPADTPNILNATTYTEQTANFTGSIKSSSANDAAAGTGARTVRITYYTQTGAGPYTEDVTLNGTTAVNLVNTDHCYIEKMEVRTAGSLKWNAGTITLYTGAGGAGTAVGSIGYGIVYASGGDNQTLWAHHYVALGKTASVYNLAGGTTGNQTGIVFMRIATPLVANSVDRQPTGAVVVALNSSHVTRPTANPIIVAGFAKVYLLVTSNGTNTTFFGSFDYSEV